MDESPKQLIEMCNSIPAKPEQEERVDYEYISHGVVNIFMANEPLKGKRMVKVTSTKTKIDWARFIKRISDEMHPEADKITLNMDNFKTHTSGALYEASESEEAKRIWDRFNFVFTPKHGSWLNMAEIEFHVLNKQCLNRHIPTIDQITKEVVVWQEYRNNKDAVINWQFTNKDARIKLKRLYPSINN